MDDAPQTNKLSTRTIIERLKEQNMTNNDLLIRLRYALDLKNREMVEIFALGGYEMSPEKLPKYLSKPTLDEDGEVVQTDDYIACNDALFEKFMNGFVTYKRGKQEVKPGQTLPPAPKKKDHPNNILLKRIKIALSLTTEDMIEIFYDAGLNVSKGELGAIMRKADHRNYKECGDNFARNFLKGLTLKYRND